MPLERDSGRSSASVLVLPKLKNTNGLEKELVELASTIGLPHSSEGGILLKSAALGPERALSKGA